MASEVIAQAHADLAAGQAWRARDGLVRSLEHTLDEDALAVLGGVLYGMGDLPAAGAAWFGTSKSGTEVEESIKAWREHHDDHFGNMWRSLPRSVRRSSEVPRVEALKHKAIERDELDGKEPYVAPEPPKEGIDAALVVAYIIAGLLVICAAVGLVQILSWMTPGS
ncbi:MAG TPA: hypothetical protein GXZ60_04630 [Intrasporangiaceae bacterium]|nr:hypothetical protein [Intrasporangiaceae bacterium]